MLLRGTDTQGQASALQEARHCGTGLTARQHIKCASGMNTMELC